MIRKMSRHTVDPSLARKVYDLCHLNRNVQAALRQVSDEYFDRYLFEGQPALLREVAHAMVRLVPVCDTLAGMELGGIPIAAVMSQLTGSQRSLCARELRTTGHVTRSKATLSRGFGWS
jgi:orotate phosphoribosyltransferase